MLRSSAAILLVLCLIPEAADAQYPGARPAPARWRAGFESIQLGDAKRITYTLGGPDFEGRAPKTLGFPAAAGYVAAHLQIAGVQPAGDNGSYFQHLTVVDSKPEPTAMRLGLADGSLNLDWSTDFVFDAGLDFSSKFRVAFARIPKGAKVADLDLNRANGRVLIFTHEEATQDASGMAWANTVGSPVVPGRLLVVQVGPGARPLRVSSGSWVKQAPEDAPGFTGLRLTTAAARKLATALGASEFAKGASTKATLELPEKELSASGKYAVTAQYETMNVLGLIEGSDPALRREFVVIGSHLDHLGPAPEGTYFGADDNASGSTANLLVAQALARNPQKPKRSVLIAFWTCEESGLFGSQMFAANPKVPLANIAAYLNMDMVGRNAEYKRWGDLPGDNENAVYNGSVRLNSPELRTAMARANRFVNLNIRDDKEDRTFRSDTGNFARLAIPTSKVSTGEHPDYHKITDTVGKLNIPKLVSVAKWMYLSAIEVGEAPRRPAFIASAKYLTGTVVAPAGVVFGPETSFEVQLVDISGKDPVVLDRTGQKRPGQSPFVFALAYCPESIVPTARIVVRASVHAGKKLILVSEAVVPVLTQGGPVAGIVVPVVPVKSK
ncbi:MAG: M20/M25/M40 family metallo-hydrolase [Fimbriimonas sp.]